MGIEIMDKYTNALRRLYVGSGFIAGAGLTWVVSEIVSTLPLTFYFALISLVVFGVVALIDSWRLG